MKPPIKVSYFCLSGVPPKNAIFSLVDGTEITIRLGKKCLLPDGGFKWDTLPLLLIQAAAQGGYEKLIYPLP